MKLNLGLDVASSSGVSSRTADSICPNDSDPSKILLAKNSSTTTEKELITHHLFGVFVIARMEAMTSRSARLEPGRPPIGATI
jgi:hypothetical protein